MRDVADKLEVFRVKIGSKVMQGNQCVNPEAAYFLGILAIRSKGTLPNLPVSGDGTSPKAVVCEALNNITWTDDGSITAAAESFQDQGADTYSAFTWRLRDNGERGTLYITHRRISGATGVRTQIYPDLAVTLRRVQPSRGDDIGYWVAERMDAVRD
jgi:hypothetical protein